MVDGVLCYLWKNIISTESVDIQGKSMSFPLWKNIISTESVDEEDKRGKY